MLKTGLVWAMRSPLLHFGMFIPYFACFPEVLLKGRYEDRKLVVGEARESISEEACAFLFLVEMYPVLRGLLTRSADGVEGVGVHVDGTGLEAENGGGVQEVEVEMEGDHKVEGTGLEVEGGQEVKGVALEEE